mgnify:CR=1 FL=1
MSEVFTVNSVQLPILGFELRTLDDGCLVGNICNGRVDGRYEETSGDAFCADIFSSTENVELVATLRGLVSDISDRDRQKYFELPASVKYLCKMSLDCMNVGNGRVLSMLNSLKTLVRYAMVAEGKKLKESELALIVSTSVDTMLTLYENTVIFEDMVKADVSIVNRGGVDVMIIR